MTSASAFDVPRKTPSRVSKPLPALLITARPEALVRVESRNQSVDAGVKFPQVEDWVPVFEPEPAVPV